MRGMPLFQKAGKLLGARGGAAAVDKPEIIDSDRTIARYKMLRFLRRADKRDEVKTAEAAAKTRRTFFGQMTGLFRRSRIDDELWDELEELLISADVGVETTFKLMDSLREGVRRERISDPRDALALLKEEMTALVDFEAVDEALEVREKPLVILMVGVNGAGKTTGSAKLARMYADAGQRVLVGAADTFRAAAIEQLQAWGGKVGVDVIAHKQGADPGSVAYDTLQAARSRKSDVVIIDTAGRLHTKSNLMQELQKIERVLSRHGANSVRTLLTIDATTGQNGLHQAHGFAVAVECEGVFLAKMDSSSKGGIVFAIADEAGYTRAVYRDGGAGG